ncbi:SDR family NAD(P)-dependent oxidoreductase [Mycolicibacterium brumae]|uniref:3-oxoacyl-ACP reductase n=1 Tax=Mycolicibacterium brumae TaxID=85968 RepID=A0A2G5PCC6_9MYCO|nr:glucose 1-dehydrogenase [Mycolicibacterium brumae]MCV7193095.1 glucose 1-dehydrogenase [Mycolicibacterium brumae]PIB75998.1 3-oxoacyl-ACP reductase [Mycolicibacterium brumae]UWW09751.1 glucose 1-dehydrogenase [Mycolicibacterium brumae]
MSRLTGKVAIVTGSSRGIGAATARRLASDGATVVVNYVASQDKADAVVDSIEAAGGRAVAMRADMGNWSQAQELVRKAATDLGRLDVLVNNAVQEVGREPIDDVTEAFTRKQFDVNILGPIATMQAAAPLFPEDGGRIINISSCVTVFPLPWSTVYVATKAGLEAATRSLAAELGPRNITVNSIGVGFTNTDLIGTNTQEQDDALIARTPLGRIGEPEDIADAVSLLASPDARWITGQLVLATGGIVP